LSVRQRLSHRPGRAYDQDTLGITQGSGHEPTNLCRSANGEASFLGEAAYSTSDRPSGMSENTSNPVHRHRENRLGLGSRLPIRRRALTRVG
jgi:hypothetical protein